MDAKGEGSAQGQVIDLSQLPVQQLNQLVQSLEQEVEFFQSSMMHLKEIQKKLMDSQEALKGANSQNSGKDVLVPLTSSLYVPGKLSKDNRVLVDIGTGYYVEKTINEASLFFKRKIEFMTKQIEKIQPMMQSKFSLKQAALEILQRKMQALSQQQQVAQASKA